MALSLYGGQTGDPKAVADAVRPKVRELAQGFVDRFGSLECRNLVPFDFNTPGGYEAFRKSGVKQQRCHNYVAYAVRTVATWKESGSLTSTQP